MCVVSVRGFDSVCTKCVLCCVGVVRQTGIGVVLRSIFDVFAVFQPLSFECTQAMIFATSSTDGEKWSGEDNCVTVMVQIKIRYRRREAENIHGRSAA